MSRGSDTPPIYDPGVLEADPAFAVPPPDDDLVARAQAAGWPEGFLERVLALRRNRAEVDAFLDSGFPTAEMLEGWVQMHQALLSSTLVARQATWEDDDLLVDLCANAPQTVGEWTVTVERGPNPYAQFRLQEHPNIIVLEDRRVALGMAAHSVRNTIIGGEKTSAHHMSGWRVRDGFRGMGLSRMLQFAAGPGVGWFGLVTYYFVRTGNDAAGWISKINDDMADRPEGYAVQTAAETASVISFGDPSKGVRSARVRPATTEDLARCRELINRTHDGLDLFRPYSEDYLDQRMSDPNWGPKPPFYPAVYGLADYRVLEADGEIVACGGLWDRGRDLREVWERGSGAERFVVDPTALMDFGFADGRHEAMVELLAHLLAESQGLGRSGLLAPLQFLPEVVDAAAHLDPLVETRDLHVNPFTSPELKVEATIARPYIDLAYW